MNKRIEQILRTKNHQQGTNVITIDGPAASGKSSTARAVARALQFLFVSSGSYYRALAWSALEHAIDLSDEQAVASWLTTIRLESKIENGEVCLLLNGVDPAAHRADPAVNALVSPLAALPAVRTFLLNVLRDLAKNHNLVMEGRDIGSVVFPDAFFKFYLDASLEERMRRRNHEGTLDAIAKRDQQDATRKVAPLLIPEGAVVIDTTALSINETVQKILACVNAAYSGANN